MLDERIVICGAGTLGGNLAEHLARLGCPALSVIDDDKVEAHNLANQPYHRNDVGRPKVKALSELLYRAAGTRVEGVGKKLGTRNADHLLSGFALVVDAFDNHGGRTAVQAACRRLGTPCLHIGLSNDGYGEVVWDDNYQVPDDQPRDACTQHGERTLALLVVAAASHAILRWASHGACVGFTITGGDLRISET